MGYARVRVRLERMAKAKRREERREERRRRVWVYIVERNGRYEN